MGMLKSAWRRLRGLRPPRRLLFTRSGAVFTAGILAVGLAAVNTGNNLLFLLLGALLGLVALSGLLSEQMVRPISVVRKVPRGVPVGQPARIRYDITNRGSRLPVYTIELRETGLPGAAFGPVVPPGETLTIRNDPVFIRRGTVPLDTLILATAFPFGLFRKERDLSLPGELVIWPSTQRPVRPLDLAGDRSREQGSRASARAVHRGDYRSLREYRPGDDPRDVHWKAAARSGALMVREYEGEDAAGIWVCLDAAAPPGVEAERAVEIAASILARTLREGREVGFATQGRVHTPGKGEAHLEGILDTLARLDFDPRLPPLVPVGEAERCVLVTPGARGAGAFGDVIRSGAEEP